jgi:hypothetical protein
MERGSLHALLRPSGGGGGAEAAALGRRALRRIALDVCEGVAYLHAMRTLHRDLKSPNVLVGADGRAKLGDFGLSKTMGTIMSHVSAGGGGTAAWSAPERFTGAQIGFPSDVYSLGVVLWECLTHQVPWASVENNAIVGMVGYAGQRLQIPADHAGDPLAAIIADCFATEPAARPTAAQVHERVTAVWQAEGDGGDSLPAAALEAKVRALAAARGDGEDVLRGGQCRVLPIGEACAGGPLEREIFYTVIGLFATSNGRFLQDMRVARVDCVLNAAVEGRFEAARAEFAAAGCGDEEFPLFHGAGADAVAGICDKGFLTPQQVVALGLGALLDPGYFGNGIYVGLQADSAVHYAQTYRGSPHVILARAAPGRVYDVQVREGVPPQQQEAFGQPCKAGFHSHRSPQGKELVLFQAEQLVPMFVLTLAGGEHVSAADRAAAAAVAAAPAPGDHRHHPHLAAHGSRARRPVRKSHPLPLRESGQKRQRVRRRVRPVPLCMRMGRSLLRTRVEGCPSQWSGDSRCAVRKHGTWQELVLRVLARTCVRRE